MREIDDRYPEIGRPFAQTGGGKHYKSLTWLQPAALAVCSVLLMAGVLAVPTGPRIRTSGPSYNQPVVHIALNIASRNDYFQGIGSACLYRALLYRSAYLI